MTDRGWIDWRDDHGVMHESPILVSFDYEGRGWCVVWHIDRFRVVPGELSEARGREALGLLSDAEQYMVQHVLADQVAQMSTRDMVELLLQGLTAQEMRRIGGGSSS